MSGFFGFWPSIMLFLDVRAIMSPAYHKLTGPGNSGQKHQDYSGPSHTQESISLVCRNIDIMPVFVDSVHDLVDDNRNNGGSNTQ